MLRQESVHSQKTITRKNLVNSLITGLFLGTLIGAPIGWFVHQFYYQQQLAKYLVCREQNLNQPTAVVESICGSRF
jgi:hypothetical protein